MRLVEALVVRGEAEVLDAHLSFQLNAGVDFVLAAADASSAAAAAVLESYASEGYLERIPAPPGANEAEQQARLARIAADAHGADWVISTAPEEFWWPRAESLKAVLEPVPPRYTIVQALVRALAPRPGSEGDFAARMTVRAVLDAARAPETREGTLRHVRRVRPGLTDDDDGRVPLRAWYPIEVFRVPMPGGGEAEPAGERIAHGLADGSLVIDERLRDALRRLGATPAAGPARRYALPSETSRGAGLVVPSVVDDAAYAVECAAAGEVDLALLDEQIRDLEGRITELESGFWPRVVRKLSRSATRPPV